MTFRGWRTEGRLLKRAKSSRGLPGGLTRGRGGLRLLLLLAGLGGGVEGPGGGGTQVYCAQLADAVNVG